MQPRSPALAGFAGRGRGGSPGRAAATPYPGKGYGLASLNIEDLVTDPPPICKLQPGLLSPIGAAQGVGDTRAAPAKIHCHHWHGDNQGERSWIF